MPRATILPSGPQKPLTPTLAVLKELTAGWEVDKEIRLSKSPDGEQAPEWVSVRWETKGREAFEKQLQAMGYQHEHHRKRWSVWSWRLDIGGLRPDGAEDPGVYVKGYVTLMEEDETP